MSDRDVLPVYIKEDIDLIWGLHGLIYRTMRPMSRPQTKKMADELLSNNDCDKGEDQ